MLAIRMQRVGRRGHAQFRMIVQDSRFHPTSGRVVAYLGSYNPHTKTSSFDKEKLETYLTKGAQPTPRVVKLLKTEKVKLPSWVSKPPKKKKAVRNPDKRRSTRPAGASEPEAKAPADLSPEASAKGDQSPEALAKGEETPSTDEVAEVPAKAEQPAEAQAEETAEPTEAQAEETSEASTDEVQPEESSPPEK